MRTHAGIRAEPKSGTRLAQSSRGTQPSAAELKRRFLSLSRRCVVRLLPLPSLAPQPSQQAQFPCGLVSLALLLQQPSLCSLRLGLALQSPLSSLLYLPCNPPFAEFAGSGWGVMLRQSNGFVISKKKEQQRREVPRRPDVDFLIC